MDRVDEDSRVHPSENTLERPPRRLGHVRAEAPGPTLIVVGGLHGNEPAGVFALERVFATLAENARGLRGELVGFSGNRRALALDERYLTSDFNRIWLEERVERVMNGDGELVDEDLELSELWTELERAIAAADGEVFLFDIHSTSGPGPAFATLDDALPNRNLAFHLPVPCVLGLEEELAGTMLSWMNPRGVNAIGFECGQHRDPLSVERAEAAIWILMEASGVLARGARPEVARARRLLTEASLGLPGVVDVRCRYEVRAGEGFRMVDGFRSFQPVRRGQHIGDHALEPVLSPLTGLLLMPLYQRQGDDAFFIVRGVNPFWLTLSAWLRRRRTERCLRYLPGVEPHPKLRGGYLVDRRRARWLVRQIFHLLGFRRASFSPTHLTMLPRDPR
jgi:succinylglutamate desuccinylase